MTTKANHDALENIGEYNHEQIDCHIKNESIHVSISDEVVSSSSTYSSDKIESIASGKVDNSEKENFVKKDIPQAIEARTRFDVGIDTVEINSMKVTEFDIKSTSSEINFCINSKFNDTIYGWEQFSNNIDSVGIPVSGGANTLSVQHCVLTLTSEEEYNYPIDDESSLRMTFLNESDVYSGCFTEFYASDFYSNSGCKLRISFSYYTSDDFPEDAGYVFLYNSDTNSIDPEGVELKSGYNEFNHIFDHIVSGNNYKLIFFVKNTFVESGSYIVIDNVFIRPSYKHVNTYSGTFNGLVIENGVVVDVIE